MNFLKNIKQTIAKTNGQRFDINYFQPVNSEERKKIATYLCILCKKGEVERVDKGFYIQKKKPSQEIFKDRSLEVGFASSGTGSELRRSKETFIELSKTNLLDLIINNKVSFRASLGCSNIQRNFRGEIISFTLNSVNIVVEDPIGMVEIKKKIREDEDEE